MSQTTWKSIGNTLLTNGLPVLGGLLAGPMGAAAGRLVGNALGAGDPDSPDQVKSAMYQDMTGSVDKLRQLESQQAHELAVMELKAEMESIKAVNKTARVEAKSDDAFVRRARPSLIYGSMVLMFGVFGLVGFVAIHRPDSLDQLVSIFGELWIPMTTLLAAAGVYVPHRSRDKQVASGQTPSPGILGAITTKLMG